MWIPLHSSGFKSHLVLIWYSICSIFPKGTLAQLHWPCSLSDLWADPTIVNMITLINKFRALRRVAWLLLRGNASHWRSMLTQPSCLPSRLATRTTTWTASRRSQLWPPALPKPFCLPCLPTANDLCPSDKNQFWPLLYLQHQLVALITWNKN